MPMQNRLLATLPEGDLRALKQYMQTVLLRYQTVLYEPGDRLTHIYFPDEGVICKGALDGAGRMVGTAIVGADGMVGAFAALDGLQEQSRAFVHVQGTASTIGIDALRRIALENRAIGAMLHSYCRYLYVCGQHAAVCNASHTLEQRLCLSLVRLHHLSQRRMIEVTQEQLGEWLAVKRTSVCFIAHGMQERGLIRVRRGKIEIIDLEGLTRSSCNCHRFLSSYYDSLFNTNVASKSVDSMMLAKV